MAHKIHKRPRKLEEIPSESVVCVDANILTYHFNEYPQFSAISTAFLERGLRDEINIVTSPQIVSDVIHRSMIVEAQESLQLEHKELASYLKNHPQVVRKFKRNLRIPSLISRLNIKILPLNYIHHHAAKLFRQNYGMMADDSLILGFMQIEKIPYLATNDRDFRRVKEIIIWEP